MTTSIAVGRGPAESWRALRKPLLITGVVVLVGLIVLIFSVAGTSGPFSPDSTERDGARALANLLKKHGVNVQGTEFLDDATKPGAGKALLIGPNGSLDRDDWQRIKAAGWSHLILIRPGARELDALAPGVKSAGPVLSSASREPDCDLSAAVRAGNVTAGGTTYFAPAGAKACYGDGINHTVIRVETGGQIVDVVGTSRSFTNNELADDGNAALALNLIGTHQELTWYLPQWESSGTDDEGSDGPPLVPPDIRYIGWALAFAVLVVAVWRGRRLGPVVMERLPVIVRAAETTEGRARLYRRARAHDRAAAALRESALAQLHKAHGIPRRAEPSAVVATLAARIGWDPNTLYEALYGMPPQDDAALLHLSDVLEVLMQEAP